MQLSQTYVALHMVEVDEQLSIRKVDEQTNRYGMLPCMCAASTFLVLYEHKAFHLGRYCC